MNRYLLLAGLLITGPLSTFAQGQDNAATAAAIAARQEAAEERRMIRNELDRLNESLVQQQRTINTMANEIRSLQERLNESEQRNRASQANAVTRKDLEKIVDALKEVDSKRVADNNVIKEQIKKVAEIAAHPQQVIVQAPPILSTPPPEIKNPRETSKPDKNDNEDDQTPPPNPRGYYNYKIQSKDTLMGIINAYNAKFKEQGKATISLDQVKKANPKLNPNRMVVGKEVLIPIPPDK